MAMSTTKAKYMTVIEVGKYDLWVKDMLRNWVKQVEVQLLSDSKNVIYQKNNQACLTMTKYIDARFDKTIACIG